MLQFFDNMQCLSTNISLARCQVVGSAAFPIRHPPIWYLQTYVELVHSTAHRSCGQNGAHVWRHCFAEVRAYFPSFFFLFFLFRNDFVICSGPRRCPGDKVPIRTRKSLLARTGICCTCPDKIFDLNEGKKVWTRTRNFQCWLVLVGRAGWSKNGCSHLKHSESLKRLTQDLCTKFEPNRTKIGKVSPLWNFFPKIEIWLVGPVCVGEIGSRIRIHSR